MSYLYKSITGSTTNIGPYVISVSGTSFSSAIAELDAFVDITVSKEVDGELVAIEEQTIVVVEELLPEPIVEEVVEELPPGPAVEEKA